MAHKTLKDYLVIKDNKTRLTLKKIPTRVESAKYADDDYKRALKRDHESLKGSQTKLYAGQARSLLVVFQGMDTSGKDGAISHVMSGVNPQGCAVTSFKAPTSIDLNHDFFWRVNQAMPARGQIGIFNRSYYEEVLITRVHPRILSSEKIPGAHKHGAKFWSNRYRDILQHEKYLHRQGYEIVKIFIHISKAEQKRRLLDRFDDPNKHWKISESDIVERGYWKEYERAYEECLSHTAAKNCPWYIVPGDDKEKARLMISHILSTRFKKMNLKYPSLSDEQGKNLARLKAMLIKD